MLLRFLKRKKKPMRRPRGAEPVSTSLRPQLLLGAILIVVIGLLLFGIYKVTRLPGWQIETVSVVGGTTIAPEVIEAITRESLIGSYYRLIPYSFSPLYPKRSIVEHIKTTERVKHVAVERAGRQGLTVIFEEYVPAALWCTSATSTDCLFIDASGYAYTKAPQLQGGALLRYVEEGSAPERQSAGFSSDFMRTQQTFVDLLENELNLFVTTVTAIGDYDLEYTIATGGVIKTSQGIDLQTTLSNLESILTSEVFLHLQTGEFEYIDLRFGDKVFVQELTVPTTTATSSVSAEE